jgi:carboxyl-terminal processing protease
VLRFTNLEVLLPDGQSCSGRGLSPDVEVDATTLVRLPDLLRLARVRLGTEGPRPAGGG